MQHSASIRQKAWSTRWAAIAFVALGVLLAGVRLVLPGRDRGRPAALSERAESPPGKGECTPLETAGCVGGNSDGAYFRESFNGNPGQPQSAMNRLNRWFSQPVMQGALGWDLAPEPMEAQHAADCGPAPATHRIDKYEDTVFLCRDHLMTAVNPPSDGTSSGIVALKPNHMVDLSKGEAVIRVDVSTLSPSKGDWWEIWITPWEDQLIAPSDHWFHHSGAPKRAVQLVVRDFGGDAKHWAHQVWNNYQPVLSEFASDGTNVAFWKAPNIRPLVSLSDTRRDLYEVRMTTNSVKLFVKSPADNQLHLVEEFAIPGGFPANQAVVQFLQSNYEPEKNGKVGCDDPCPATTVPATWHWDNVEIVPAVPYTLIPTNEYMVWAGSASHRVTLAQPAPALARMMFSGFTKGNRPEVSFDNGQTWRAATPVRPPNDPVGVAFDGNPDLLTYTVDVPAGTTAATVRGQDVCTNCGSLWRWSLFNFHVVSKSAPGTLAASAVKADSTEPLVVALDQVDSNEGVALRPTMKNIVFTVRREDSPYTRTVESVVCIVDDSGVTESLFNENTRT